MSSEDNRKLVHQFYELMSKLEFEKMFELMVDDGTWTVAGNPDLFHHSGVATKQQRSEALKKFTVVFMTLQMDILSSTADDDRVAVELQTRCVTHSGLTYENELFALVRCRGGKIISIYEHLDQATALEFGRRLAALS